MHIPSSHSYRKGDYQKSAQHPSLRMAFSAPRARYVSSYVFRPHKRRIKSVLILMVLVVALGVFIYGNAVGPHESVVMVNRAPVAPKSTPVEQWHKGEVPYLYQIDPEWSQKPYAGGTIEENGCGPLCLSMVYVACTGKKDYGPVHMCALSEQKGFVYDGATKWSFMTEGAAYVGLTSQEIAANKATLLAELEAGNPCIAIMGPGDFTEKGHFIVLAGITEQEKIVVHDPNSVENSSRVWDVQTILKQARGLWAFEGA